jgi:hypothetical protein
MLVSGIRALTTVQSTPHQTIHHGLCTALILKALALISNCKCIVQLYMPPTWQKDQDILLKWFFHTLVICSYFCSTITDVSYSQTSQKSIHRFGGDILDLATIVHVSKWNIASAIFSPYLSVVQWITFLCLNIVFWSRLLFQRFYCEEYTIILNFLHGNGNTHKYSF